MFQLSSSFTILLRLFLPIFLPGFFTLFSIAAWYLNDEMPFFYVENGFQWLITGLAISAWIFAIFGLLPLKRVDADDQCMVVSDYFRSVKIPYIAIDKLIIDKMFGFTRVRVHLIHKGLFGSKFTFVTRSYRMEKWKKTAGTILPLV
jgi:hypothetical protein